jgi:hypothetical protein
MLCEKGKRGFYDSIAAFLMDEWRDAQGIIPV